MRTPKACTVRLYIRIRRADGQCAYTDPAYNNNHSLCEGYALIAGKAEANPKSVYYLRFLNGKKRVWQSVGPAADAALAALNNKKFDLEAVALGRSLPEPSREEVPTVAEETPAGTVAKAIGTYVVSVANAHC